MTLLKELLEEIKPLKLDEQVKMLCDKISEEEKDNDKKKIFNGPVGPNIFLSLEVFKKGLTKEYLCLERESPGNYIVSFWKRQLKKDSVPKRMRVVIVSGTKSEIILKEYARHMKFMKGD